MKASTLIEQACQLADGRLSAQQIISTQLDRIEDHLTSSGAAYIEFQADHERDHALSLAQSHDQLRAHGSVISPYSGLSFSVKDLFDVAGQRTRAGSQVLNDVHPASYDAIAVERLKKAGLIMLGRTNMSEFAYTGLGINSHYGSPRNPFDSKRITGGSTSGGALSVALGMANIALGTDTGGSLRIPAAFCGLTGFKPSANRVPTRGALPLSTTLDSIGAITRSVSDCAIIDAILSNETLDLEQFESIPSDGRGLYLGIAEQGFLDDLDPVVTQAFDRALKLLRDKGVTLIKLDTSFMKQAAGFGFGGRFTASEAWNSYHALLESRGNEFDPRVAKRMSIGGSLLANDYVEAFRERQALINDAAHTLGTVDAWLMPTVACVAPEIEPLEKNEDTYFRTNAKVLRNTSLINLLDGCAISLPCHKEGELPVGLSICGNNGTDRQILKIARSVEFILAG